MELIEPQVELLSELGITPESHIARCARVCYGREYKEPNQAADKKLVEGLIKRGHLSMLRHASMYLSNIKDISQFATHIANSCYWNYDAIREYASTNLQEFTQSGVEKEPVAVIDNKQFLEDCAKHPRLFELYRLTFCITTQISTSRELNRVSPNNIAERSTRFCSAKCGLAICRPWWIKSPIEDAVSALSYYNLACEAEKTYMTLLLRGMKPEDARGVLPLDTATKVIYTYSVKEWQHILDLRYYGTTGEPHPNAKLITGEIRDEINKFATKHGIDYKV